jgi:hypothetical protein
VDPPEEPLEDPLEEPDPVVVDVEVASFFFSVVPLVLEPPVPGSVAELPPRLSVR